MRTPPRSRTSLLVALASLITLSACIGGMPYRRPGSDLVTREGPSDTPWWSSLVACRVMADSSSGRGASGGSRDCADSKPATGTARAPTPATGQKAP